VRLAASSMFSLWGFYILYYEALEQPGPDFEKSDKAYQ